MSNGHDETGSLNLRKFPEDTKLTAKRYAGARGLTLPAYFARLVALHEAALAAQQIELLESAGLEPLTR